MTKTALDGSATGCIAKRDLTDSASMRAFEDNFGRGALQLVRPYRSHGQDLRNTSSSLNLSMNERLKFGGSRAVLSVRVWVWCQNRTRPLKKACAKSAWRMAGDAGHRGYAAYQAAAACRASN